MSYISAPVHGGYGVAWILCVCVMYFWSPTTSRTWNENAYVKNGYVSLLIMHILYKTILIQMLKCASAKSELNYMQLIAHYTPFAEAIDIDRWPRPARRAN